MRFCPDVTHYKQFYATSLGRLVRNAITHKIFNLWPELGGDTMVGMGYAAPYLKPYLRQGNGDIVNFMTAQQGAVYWPRNRENLCSLIDAEQLPLRDGQVNRVLMIHALEYSEHPVEWVQEIWRVLTPGGRAIIVVPHRQSWWARSERSVFAHGYPYRPGQLKQIVEEVGFTVVQTHGALYFPPIAWRWMHKPMGWLESVGRLLTTYLGGVVVMQVEKQLYATAKPKPKKALLEGVYAPSGKPAMTRLGN